MKPHSLIILCFFSILMLGCNSSSAAEQDAPLANNPTPNKKVQPYFKVNDLIGKDQKSVDKVLGAATEDWDMKGESDRRMRSYSLGEETTVQFHKNRIENLVIFTAQKSLNKTDSYRLIGLDSNYSLPDGISEIKVGDGWVKIYFGS